MGTSSGPFRQVMLQYRCAKYELRESSDAERSSSTQARKVLRYLNRCGLRHMAVKGRRPLGRSLVVYTCDVLHDGGLSGQVGPSGWVRVRGAHSYQLGLSRVTS